MHTCWTVWTRPLRLAAAESRVQEESPVPRALLLAHGKRRLTVHTAPARGAVTFPLNAHAVAGAHRIQAVLWKAGNIQVRAPLQWFPSEIHQGFRLIWWFSCKYPNWSDVNKHKEKKDYANICASISQNQENKKACRLLEIIWFCLSRILSYFKTLMPRTDLLVQVSAGLCFCSRAGKELEQLIITSAIVHCVSIWVFVLCVSFTSGKRKIYSFTFLRKFISTAENLIQKIWPSTNPE